VPSLWEHEAVTYQKRQQILGCLIDHIVVTADRKRVDATIVWKAGARTPLVVWRERNHEHLLRELREQQLTIAEMRAHLTTGRTSTGQIINIGESTIRRALKKLGLQAPRYTASRLSVRQTAAELYAQGQSLASIAQYFNEQGFETPSGRPWTHCMVQLLIRRSAKDESNDSLHRNQSRMRVHGDSAVNKWHLSLTRRTSGKEAASDGRQKV
jgi:Recombinase